jgi:hypothetical protein
MIFSLQSKKIPSHFMIQIKIKDPNIQENLLLGRLIKNSMVLRGNKAIISFWIRRKFHRESVEIRNLEKLPNQKKAIELIVSTFKTV